ncbi:tRNA lysidine(34) synthetase TilS [Micrococcales bacterium 31B]|nr:tRNA lysidine(34) synthetase TilS [Micrococcales bacterium 31B]
MTALRELTVETPGGEPALILIACSGGADSLALAAAAAFVQTSREFEGRVRCGAVIVDHGLQAGSGAVAARAAEQCVRLGLGPVRVIAAEISDTAAPAARSGGLEAVARRGRYSALLTAARELGAWAVCTGHTADDQAETVLLALARGAGLTALRGMRERQPLAGVVTGGTHDDAASPLLVRPLLGATRADTEAACRAEGLEPWHDPMNDDASLRRVRVRRDLLPLAEQSLGPGFAAALARTARRVAADQDALDALADAEFAARAVTRRDRGDGIAVPVAGLATLPLAIRTRLWLRAARQAGSGGELSERHLLAVDALVSNWHGQGLTNLPGGVAVWRECEKIRFHGVRGRPGPE